MKVGAGKLYSFGYSCEYRVYQDLNLRGFTMAAISAAMVKELRERTGLGMMECKRHWLNRQVILMRRLKS